MTPTTVDLPSVCPLDCPDTCSLTVTVEADRIVKIRGSHANPYTAGVLCAKVPAMYPEFVHGPGRLTTPLRRIGAKGEGRFEPISWTTALDEIHRRFTAVMAEHGPQAIMPLNYGGPHGMLAGASMDLRFFHRLGATLLDRGPLCGGIRTEAWNGTFGALAPGIPPEQIEHARLIVAWGNNVTWSNLHLTPLIDRARRAGAKLVVVDPKRTKIAERADLHLPLRPGTDVVLAWAIAAELERTGGLDHAFIERHVAGFEEYMALARPWTLPLAARECRLAEADVRRFAEWFRTTAPVAISVGNGLERNQNGGSGIRAVFALPALAGKFGVRGGGLVNGARGAFPKTPARLARPDLVPKGTRLLNIVDVGRHLTDPTLTPPLKAIFVYNHNPLIVHPDQNRMRRGLSREDLFVVGCDVVMTDSLAYADIVLPACSHFEHADIFAAYGQHWLQRAEPVIQPQGEALPNTEIFRRLAARFGFTEPAFTASTPSSWTTRSTATTRASAASRRAGSPSAPPSPCASRARRRTFSTTSFPPRPPARSSSRRPTSSSASARGFRAIGPIGRSIRWSSSRPPPTSGPRRRSAAYAATRPRRRSRFTRTMQRRARSTTACASASSTSWAKSIYPCA